MSALVCAAAPEQLQSDPVRELEIMHGELASLCTHVEYLCSWWNHYGDRIRDMDRLAARRIHDHFIDGVSFSRSVARVAGVEIDREAIGSYNWERPSILPPAPEVGPEPPFRYCGGNLGLTDGPVSINVAVPGGRAEVSLEWALRNIGRFAEPGRTRLLLEVAHEFDVEIETGVVTATVAEVSGADRHGWIKVAAGALPDTDRDVQAWDGVDEMSIPAFYAADENRWFSKCDGEQFDKGRITHWREVQAPEGVSV